MLMSRLDAYTSRSGDFCGDNDRQTDDRPTKLIALPLAHACGVTMENSLKYLAKVIKHYTINGSRTHTHFKG